MFLGQRRNADSRMSWKRVSENARSTWWRCQFPGQISVAAGWRGLCVASASRETPVVVNERIKEKITWDVPDGENLSVFP